MNTHRKKTAHLRQIALLLSLMFSMEYAFAWTKEYTQDFNMGDNDSRNTAREWAVDQIKLKAAQEAGTYIQGTTKLVGNDLQETITQIGASIVRITVNSDAMITTADGKPALRVSATADVDESVLTQRIKMMQEDDKKARDLQLLAQENQKLREEILALAAQKTTTTDSKALADILARETTILASLDRNSTRTQEIFVPTNNAMQAAIQEALARKSKADDQINQIEKYFADRKAGITFTSEIKDLKLRDDGSRFDGKLVVRISFPAETSRFLADISRNPENFDMRAIRHFVEKADYYGVIVAFGGKDWKYIPIQKFRDLPTITEFPISIAAADMQAAPDFSLRFDAGDAVHNASNLCEKLLGRYNALQEQKLAAGNFPLKNRMMLGSALSFYGSGDDQQISRIPSEWLPIAKLKRALHDRCPFEPLTISNFPYAKDTSFSSGKKIPEVKLETVHSPFLGVRRVNRLLKNPATAA